MSRVGQDNYPDLLNRADVAPAAWFFSMCYAITSRVMTPQQREKFHMISGDNLAALHTTISPTILPFHLGGSDTVYKSEIRVDFVPENSSIPIDIERLRKFYSDLEAANKIGAWYG